MQTARTRPHSVPVMHSMKHAHLSLDPAELGDIVRPARAHVVVGEHEQRLVDERLETWRYILEPSNQIVNISKTTNFSYETQRELSRKRIRGIITVRLETESCS